MAENAIYTERLLALKTEIFGRLRAIDTELDSHQSKDWQELATEREDDEVLERLGSHGLAEIQRIDAALDRIENGRFGVCVRCGEAISAERLQVLPYTSTCRPCAV
jgi:RNA polymerase-binding transcription factor DksA